MATDTAVETPAAGEQAASAAPVAASAEPRTPEKEPASAAKPKGETKAKPEKKAKPDKKQDKKGGKGAKASEADGDGPSVAAHPRAARSVARAKGWGGLAGFVLGGYLSLPTNTLVAAGLRALAAGVVCYVATWAGAVFLWRRLVMLEIKGREQQLAAAQAAARRELPPAPAERPTASTGSRARSAA